MQRRTRGPEPFAVALPRARSVGRALQLQLGISGAASHGSRRVSVGRRAPAAPAAELPARKMLRGGLAGLIESSHERVQHDPPDAKAVGSSVALTPLRLGSAVSPYRSGRIGSRQHLRAHPMLDTLESRSGSCCLARVSGLGSFGHPTATRWTIALAAIVRSSRSSIARYAPGPGSAIAA